MQQADSAPAPQLCCCLLLLLLHTQGCIPVCASLVQTPTAVTAVGHAAWSRLVPLPTSPMPQVDSSRLATVSMLLCVLAGGYAKNTLLTFGSLDALDRERCLLLVPESRGSTWDVIRGGFGPNVRFTDAAMQHVFGRFAVDPCRYGLAGGKRLCVSGQHVHT